LIDPGAMLATTHRLESGLRVRLRLTKPSDGTRMRRFLSGVSRRSLHLRFGRSDHAEIDHRELTFYDPRRRLVVAAAAPGDNSIEEIVGVADVMLLETGLAEIALLVDDEHQTKGIGRLMSEAIAHMAVQRGATHLKASLSEPNPAIEALLERLGPTVRVVEDGGTAAYTRLPALAGRSAA
jgi:GNAT superfamily N-acetyltransferase